MKKLYFVFALITQLLSFRIASAEINTGDIIKLHEKNYLNIYNTVYYEASTENTFKSTAPINGKSESCRIEFCKNGYDNDVKVHRTTLGQNFQQEHNYFNRYVIINQEFIDYNYENNKPPSFISIDGRKNMIEDYQRRSILYHLGIGRILDGYYAGFGNQTIAELLKNEPDIKIKRSKEILDGTEMILLECNSKYGNLRLWLDPAFGFNMKK